jgi:hypothetical protein
MEVEAHGEARRRPGLHTEVASLRKLPELGPEARAISMTGRSADAAGCHTQAESDNDDYFTYVTSAVELAVRSGPPTG